ncbi:hypothetical protein CFAM422_003654 [Trichoderma lentiforme]|uniref:Uncharacterized protein n=1 Tax=Trichoderma lentiforme TaxID=1567552 RepID=A0A9P4XM02_9HYPO|nr:hypothetical protein CFAM422_003654 [Trichoderma lentiforme]
MPDIAQIPCITASESFYYDNMTKRRSAFAGPPKSRLPQMQPANPCVLRSLFRKAFLKRSTQFYI